MTLELPIPIAMVGRIIGKQGKKVLELQRESHAIIEVPMGSSSLEDFMSPTSSKSSNSCLNAAIMVDGVLQSNKDLNEIMLVKLLGHFWALQVRPVLSGTLLLISIGRAFL